MSSPTLVIADYPIGYSSGFGETLYNLFKGFPDDKLWTAHPVHLSADENKTRGLSVKIPSPRRPKFIHRRISLAYYPLLKTHQFVASRQTVRILGKIVNQKSVRNLLVIPVTPWILSSAIQLHRINPSLNLVIFVMDDWQGHHECHTLPYSSRRRRLLAEAINRASTRFAVSLEMAKHYEEVYGKSWQIAHNGIGGDSVIQQHALVQSNSNRVLLAGDVNVFRFDAVYALAAAIERHNRFHKREIEFTMMGEIAEEYRSALSALRCVKLLGRQSHSECLRAMKMADLLYLPLAFSKRSKRISLYSMPTKLPEYLASGKPVLFHAPENSAAYQVAKRYDLRPRLSTTNPEALDRFIEEWTSRKNVEAELIGARTALLEEFDIGKLAQNFQAAFV
ncbi:MAG TPA: glycosyltransferase [Pyrinomonadaceae bacterium]